MKLFIRREPKTSHPHAEALQHIANAHKALTKGHATEGRRHIGKAFAAVQHAMPKATHAMSEDDENTDPMMAAAAAANDDTSSPSPSKSSATAAFARLRGLNQKG